MQLIVVAASESLSKRIILYLQLCNLRTKQSNILLAQVCRPKGMLCFLFFIFPLTKSMVYYYSEDLQVLKGGLLELCMANIPQLLTFLTERTVFSPADTE